jgi:hypothetical protein
MNLDTTFTESEKATITSVTGLKTVALENALALPADRLINRLRDESLPNSNLIEGPLRQMNAANKIRVIAFILGLVPDEKPARKRAVATQYEQLMKHAAAGTPNEVTAPALSEKMAKGKGRTRKRDKLHADYSWYASAHTTFDLQIALGLSESGFRALRIRCGVKGQGTTTHPKSYTAADSEKLLCARLDAMAPERARTYAKKIIKLARNEDGSPVFNEEQRRRAGWEPYPTFGAMIGSLPH